MADHLFQPGNLGAIALSNRVIMAPMTRSRAGTGDIPGKIVAEYYAQRASAGLIITEGIHPSAEGKGYCRTPGLFNAAQADAWRSVVSGVHARGGRIVAQLMHVGRIATARNKDEGARTIAPSAIRARGQIHSDAAGMVDFDMPYALGTDEIADVVADYARAASLARDAGFDGVELHCASGYLPMQFLSTSSNRRTDGYGGRADNRIRFAMEVLEALAGAIGADRVGLRICPGNPFNDIQDEDPAGTHRALLRAAAPLGLAYLHLIDLRDPAIDARGLVREHWRGALILNESIGGTEARALIGAREAEAVSFGRHFIANPDLADRLRTEAPLAPFDRTTLYTPGPRGYTDYPALNGAMAAVIAS